MVDDPLPDAPRDPKVDPAAAGVPGAGLPAGLLAAYLAGADPVDLAGLVPADPGVAAANHAGLAATRAAGRTLLRIRPADRGRSVDQDGPADQGGAAPQSPPLPPTVVEIVTDDMPFLVDSITAALARAHATVRVLLHPRPVVARDGAGRLVGIGDPAAPPVRPPGGRSGRESWIRVQTRPLDGAGRDQLAAALDRVLADVRATDEDSAAMRERALALAAELDAAPPVGLDPVEVAEAAELIAWLADDYWTFIGYREYRYSAAGDPGGGDAGELTVVEGTGLGILRTTDTIPRTLPLPPTAARRAAEPTVLVLTKTNRRSTVLRPAHLDYIGVKAFDEVGTVVGERRFLGLFPPEDRGGWVLDVPVARRRARQVLAAIGADADSHDGLGVLQILGSLPRAELLASGVSELTRLARGALRLRGRRGVRVFARPEPYGRFLSFVVCLAGVEHGAGAVSAVEAALAEATGGAVDPATLAVVGSGVVRLHTIVRRPAAGLEERGPGELAEPDLPALEAALLRRLADWRADLSELLAGRLGERGEALAARWVPAFPAAYREDVSPADALADVFALDELTEDGAPDLTAALVPPAAPGTGPADTGPSDDRQPWRFTLYRRGAELSLSRVLPVLSGLGVEVTDERPYRILSAPSVPGGAGGTPAGGAGGTPAGGAGDLWVFTFRIQLPVRVTSGAPTLPWRFAEAFLAAFAGDDDSDGLAALVVSAGLDRESVAVLRLYLRWLRQTGWTFGDDYARSALLANPPIAALLAELFTVRFDPDGSARDSAEEAVRAEVLGALDAVSALDADRILRRVLAAIGATVRTNAFARTSTVTSAPQRPLVIVLDPHAVSGLPHPVPWREIFVSSAAVEGVHLRFGPVARGGLRWSDRPEDFRTEVLGLAKAQTVKNTVIVPTGAKGGFVVRRPPAPSGDPGADREALAAAGLACYRLFIGGLLDVVDTLDPVDGEPGAAGAVGARVVRHPARTVCHDGEDSYLVVAADKGTATFSDVANRIAVDRGFWLGDAFASGGSAGFDHKAMGITAKGAWESVRRHFAELGVDADTAPITVVGIGDMSGDVFGNGMLLSSNLRLLAAFDHRHIFIDPDPDPARSFAERRRLFALPRSSWADYDPTVISAGGGVFARSAKTVSVSARAAGVLGLSGTGPQVLAPEELVRAVLHAPVDLLFNGGIGTWVKASVEPHSAAGDRANDAVRADADALRVRVIAEGGNLGMTQRGRIEFTRSGGRCNTDFVDNSAGVDTSDREVNLKILLGQAMTAGQLRPADRDALLAGATDEVATAVLADNRSQNLASATEAAQAVSLVRAHADLARRLEAAGLLERAVEAFPTHVEMGALRRSGSGLTVPELAVLSAWTKIWLTQEFTDSVVAAAAGTDVGSPRPDPLLAEVVTAYLPRSLQKRFGALAPAHPLAVGIESTVIVNGVVDVAGPTFASRLSDELAVGVDQLLLAHTAARGALGIDALLSELAEASGVEMSVAVELRIELRTLAERASRWLIRERGLPVEVDRLVTDYRDGLAAVSQALPGLLDADARAAYDERLARWRTAGVPQSVARSGAVAATGFAVAGFAVTDLARSTGRSVAAVTAVHLAVAQSLGLVGLSAAIIGLPRGDRWSTRARAALRDDLNRAHTALTAAVLTASEPTASGSAVSGSGDGTTLTDAAERVQSWLDGGADGGPRSPRARAMLAEAADPDAGALELTRLLVAVRAVLAVAEG